MILTGSALPLRGLLVILAFLLGCSRAQPPMPASEREAGALPHHGIDVFDGLLLRAEVQEHDGEEGAIRTRVVLENTTPDSSIVEFGYCTFMVWAYRAGQTELAWDQGRFRSCPDLGVEIRVSPGEEREYVLWVGDILEDSLQPGLFDFSVAYRDEQRNLHVLDAGRAYVRRTK
jgi:hypothetical protein